MKILTWNLARPQKKNYQTMIDIINSYDADIVVLTETNLNIDLGENYTFVATKKLTKNHDGINYKTDEIRTAVFSKNKILEENATFDPFTSLQIVIETQKGKCNVYATILGVFGGKGDRFKNDLDNHLTDFECFNAKNYNCIIGDFNTSFSGYAYPSHAARNILNKTFIQKNMLNLTQNLDNNVDHIIVSKDFVNQSIVNISTWNLDKKLSDHIGICVEM
jgi:endonuclease/exonuclease/phosphatase family metal-dependent hydrolase